MKSGRALSHYSVDEKIQVNLRLQSLALIREPFASVFPVDEFQASDVFERAFCQTSLCHDARGIYCCEIITERVRIGFLSIGSVSANGPSTGAWRLRLSRLADASGEGQLVQIALANRPSQAKIEFEAKEYH